MNTRRRSAAELPGSTINYYLSPAGSDSNNGLSPIEPLKTMDHINEILAGIDAVNKDIVFNLAPGFYPGASLNAYSYSRPTIKGSGNGCIIETPILVDGAWEITDIRTRSYIDALSSAYLDIRDITFELIDTLSYCISSQGICKAFGNILLTKAGGDLYRFVQCERGIADFDGVDFTVENTPTILGAFLYATDLSLIQWNLASLTGNATGIRGIVTANSIINLGSRPESYIPGTISVVAQNGGRVVGSDAAITTLTPGSIVVTANPSIATSGGAVAVQDGLPLIFVKANNSIVSQDDTDMVPVVDSNPKEFNYGSIAETESSQIINFSILNTGKAPLQVSSVSIGGANANDFVLTDVDCGVTPFTISAGSFCNVSVQFAPQDLPNAIPQESKEAILAIQSNDKVTPIYTIKLSGTVVNRAVQLTTIPQSINLGTVTQGESTTPIIVSIKNTSPLAVDIEEISLSGASADEFSLNLSPTNNPCGTPPFAVGPGDFCNVQLTGSPDISTDPILGALNKQAFLEIRPTEASVIGLAVPITLVANPALPVIDIDEGYYVNSTDTLDNTTDVEFSVTIRNTGSRRMRVYSVLPDVTAIEVPTYPVLASYSLGGSAPEITQANISDNALITNVTPTTVRITPGPLGNAPFNLDPDSFEVLTITFNAAAIYASLNGKWENFFATGQSTISPDPNYHNEAITFVTQALADVVITHNAVTENQVQLSPGAPADSFRYTSTVTLACRASFTPPA